MIILGIETSCDETSAAIISTQNNKLTVLANVVSSQVDLHAAWGGVVPNLAAREHVKNILPVIDQMFQESGIKPTQIDLIAVTKGPGLIPALLIGVNTAKALSFLWQKPLLGINHIEGHIYANFIHQLKDSPSSPEKATPLEFPLLALVVSGGHTQLVFMKEHLKYEIIGETLDDAAGEAFDKVARILGLNYPGGPLVAQRAAEAGEKRTVLKETLPRPMLQSKDFNFSFSGLKTAVLYLMKKNEDKRHDPQFIKEVCQEFQQAVIDVLVQKTILAAEKYHPKTLILAGGVSANEELKKQMEEKMTKKFPSLTYRLPFSSYSLDNAAMIAAAAYFRWQKEKEKKAAKNGWKNVTAQSNLRL